VDVDLEVELTTDGAGVAGLADHADPLTGPDPVTVVDQRRVQHVGVEVAALLSFAVDFQVVAVEDRVIAGAEHAAAGGGDQFGPAGGEDVEAFVDAAAVARRAELADRAAFAVRALDREDVGVVGLGPVGAGDARGSGSGKGRQKNEGEKGRALQWCSMTRSTMLYSFASSALMK
jgi:hypothetical protein